MQSTDIPTLIQEYFAKNASGPYIRTIPVTTTDPNAASFDVGFPPNTFVDPNAGGTPPDGRDFNYLGQIVTRWLQWVQAGGAPLSYNATFQTAIGGYPKGAVVQSAVNLGICWVSNTENNTTNPDSGGAGWQGFQIGQVEPLGQGQLQLSDSTHLILSPFNGGFLWINGFNYAIPANLKLAATGLTAGAFYYVYAYMSSGVMTLEASTTGPVVASNGIKQKAGDSTRTLVGACCPVAGPAFADSSTQRLVISYFSRIRKTMLNAFTADRTTASGSFVELNSEIRCQFITWADEPVDYYINGYVLNDQGFGITSRTSLGFDTTTSPEQQHSSVSGDGPAGIAACKSGLAEAQLHFATLLGAVGGGTGTWTGPAGLTTTGQVTIGLTIRG